MRAKRLWLALASTCIGFVTVEAALRYALFARSGLARDRFWELRVPERYFDPSSEDEYWLLRRALNPPARDPDPRELHPLLGWLDDSIDPTTFGLRSPSDSTGRRRVLLYGDSFARCMPEALPCFETLLAESPEGARFALWNYGVQGYGLDQIALLLEASLPAHREHAPIVAVAIFVERDLDRCRLSLMRVPKPRFVRRGAALELEQREVPTCADYFARASLPATSYVWRLFARSAFRDPHADEIRVVARGVLDRIRGTLDAARTERFFVLFFGASTAYAPVGGDWREEFLVAYLLEHGERFVSSRPAFAAARAAGLGSDPFLREGDSAGHYSASGNRIALRALVDGMEGRCER